MLKLKQIGSVRYNGILAQSSQKMNIMQSTISQKMNIMQSKLSGTEAFPLEPTIDMWTEIQTLGDHELDNFYFDTESLLIQHDEQHQQADPIVRIYEEDLDCTKKRSQNDNANTQHPAKKGKCTGISSGMSCDESIISQRTDASVQSAQLPFMTPIELDQQLEDTMSRLAMSMKRSEKSRQRVIWNKSSFNANPFSSNARSPHIGSYMRQLGAALYE